MRFIAASMVLLLMAAGAAHGGLLVDHEGGTVTVTEAPPGSTFLPEGFLAMPMGRPSPAELTPEVLEKVSAAAEEGLGYNYLTDTVALPTSVPYLFIRPGAWMWSPSWCTMNFVFGSPGEWELGSAGHCGRAGQEVVIWGGSPGLLFGVGTIRKSVNGGVGNDYLLAKIYPQFQGSVDMDTAVIGGPACGEFTGRASLVNPVPVKHYGHGTGIGTGGTPRAGVSFFSDSNVVFWDGSLAPGDSGGPVLTAGTTGSGVGCSLGQALAAATHIVVFGTNVQIAAGTTITKVGNVRNGNGLPT